jgi:hypothetical protein
MIANFLFSAPKLFVRKILENIPQATVGSALWCVRWSVTRSENSQDAFSKRVGKYFWWQAQHRLLFSLRLSMVIPLQTQPLLIKLLQAQFQRLCQTEHAVLQFLLQAAVAVHHLPEL